MKKLTNCALFACSIFILMGCPKKYEPPSVVIGDQVWTSQNYDGTHYRNGDSIPEVKNVAEWSALTTGAWCYYDNDVMNGEKYGRLYNHYAVMDSRGFAPKGWHLPSSGEWTKLVDYLGGASAAAYKMKSSQGWNGSGNGSNSSKLSIVPGGLRSDLVFSAEGSQGNYWTSTTDPVSGFGNMWIINGGGNVYQGDALHVAGISVRFIKDHD